MRVLLSPEAQREIEQARDYYDRQRAGLGDEFIIAVRSGAARIRSRPLTFAVEIGEVRRLILSRFPYKLLYVPLPELIYVVAVAHNHREPGYWTDRPVRPGP